VRTARYRSRMYEGLVIHPGKIVFMAPQVAFHTDGGRMFVPVPPEH
jgi:hypothetical protein